VKITDLTKGCSPALENSHILCSSIFVGCVLPLASVVVFFLLFIGFILCFALYGLVRVHALAPGVLLTT
jgi:hypothetical protein